MLAILRSMCVCACGFVVCEGAAKSAFVCVVLLVCLGGAMMYNLTPFPHPVNKQKKGLARELRELENRLASINIAAASSGSSGAPRETVSANDALVDNTSLLQPTVLSLAANPPVGGGQDFSGDLMDARNIVAGLDAKDQLESALRENFSIKTTLDVLKKALAERCV